MSQETSTTTLDILSDVLRVVRLSGSVFFNGEFLAPWVIDEPGAELLAQAAIPGASCLVMFHILVEGECYFTPKGLPKVRLQSGDVIIFPHCDKHTMSSHPDPRAALVKPALSPSPAGEVSKLLWAAAGQPRASSAAT